MTLGGLSYIVLISGVDLHAEIGDTFGMEGLEDLGAGQSHRAHLHAMLHADGNQPRTYINHPVPASSAGRGGGVMGTRGRGSFPSSPTRAHIDIPRGPQRYGSKSTLVR